MRVCARCFKSRNRSLWRLRRTTDLLESRTDVVLARTTRAVRLPGSATSIAGVVQWQNGSFPSFIRGFDSLHPLQIVKSQCLKTPQSPHTYSYTGFLLSHAGSRTTNTYQQNHGISVGVFGDQQTRYQQRALMPLSDTFTRNTKHTGAPAGDKYSDGGGIYLHITKAGKYWRMNYRFAGKQKTLALGVYPVVSLAKARQGPWIASARRRPQYRQKRRQDGHSSCSGKHL